MLSVGFFFSFKISVGFHLSLVSKGLDIFSFVTLLNFLLEMQMSLEIVYG